MTFFPERGCSQTARDLYLPRDKLQHSTKSSFLVGKIDRYGLPLITQAGQAQAMQAKSGKPDALTYRSQQKDLLFYQALCAYSRNEQSSVKEIIDSCTPEHVEPFVALILQQLIKHYLPDEQAQGYIAKLGGMPGRKIINPTVKEWEGWETLAERLFTHPHFVFDLNPFVDILSPLLNQKPLQGWLDCVLEGAGRYPSAIHKLIVQRKLQRENYTFIFRMIDNFSTDNLIALGQYPNDYPPVITDHLIETLFSRCSDLAKGAHWGETFRKIVNCLYQQRQGFLKPDELTRLQFWLTHIPETLLPELYQKLVYFYDFPFLLDRSPYINQKLSPESKLWDALQKRVEVCPEMPLTGKMVPCTVNCLKNYDAALQRRYGAFFPDHISLPYVDIKICPTTGDLLDVYLVRKNSFIRQRFRNKPHFLFNLLMRDNVFNSKLTIWQAIQGFYILLEMVRGWDPIPAQVQVDFRKLFNASLKEFNEYKQGTFASFSWFVAMGHIAKVSPNLFVELCPETNIWMNLYRKADRAVWMHSAKAAFNHAILSLAEANLTLFDPLVLRMLVGPVKTPEDSAFNIRAASLIEKILEKKGTGRGTEGTQETRNWPRDRTDI